jgi:hypothetical protein
MFQIEYSMGAGPRSGLLVRTRWLRKYGNSLLKTYRCSTSNWD